MSLAVYLRKTLRLNRGRRALTAQRPRDTVPLGEKHRFDFSIPQAALGLWKLERSNATAYRRITAYQKAA